MNSLSILSSEIVIMITFFPKVNGTTASSSACNMTIGMGQFIRLENIK